MNRRYDKAAVRRQMQEILERLDWEPEPGENVVESRSSNDSQMRSADKGSPVMRDLHKRLLSEIVQYPFLSINERAEKLGNISPHLMNRVTKELHELGMIEEPLTFSLGRRGNPRKYLQISTEGAKFIKADLEGRPFRGRGTFENCLYQHLVKEHLTGEGGNAIVEFSLNTKSIDVAQFLPDGTIKGFEVELRAIPHVIENIKRDLEAGCIEVVIVTRNRTDEKRLKTLVYRELDSEKLSKVTFQTIGEFVK